MLIPDVQPGLTQVAQTIQLATAPVFLLAGIGAFLNVCTGRLARVIDRARNVERMLLDSTGVEHDRWLREIKLLDRRMAIVNRAIFLTVASAVAVALVVVVLFTAELASMNLGTLVALLFILTMLLVMASLITFLFEVRLASQAIRVRHDVLEHRAPD